MFIFLVSTEAQFSTPNATLISVQRKGNGSSLCTTKNSLRNAQSWALRYKCMCLSVQVCTRAVAPWSGVARSCAFSWPSEAGRLARCRSCPSSRRRRHGERSVATPSGSCVVTASTDSTWTGSSRRHVAASRKINSSSLYYSKLVLIHSLLWLTSIDKLMHLYMGL